MAKNKDTDIEQGEQASEMELEGNHAEPRVYELGFHIDAELPQEEAKKTYQSLRELIASKGTVVAEGEIEKIPLAYTISRMETTGRRDFNSAYFGWISYETVGEGHAAILAAANADKRLIRFLDLRSSKEEAQHSAEMHEFYRKLPDTASQNDEEVVAEVELDAALKEVV